MGDDLQRHSPFSAFRTKQNVSKNKLDGEFAKKGWNDFSTGFSEKDSFCVQQITFAIGAESVKKKPKIDPDVFKKQIFTERCKLTKRKPVIEHKDADFFTSKAKNLCSLIQKKSLQSNNQKDLKIQNFNKCPNSVFLEVQNIQDSFQPSKSTDNSKVCVKRPSEYLRNFIADLAAKKAEQENVPKKNRASACQFISAENDFSHSAPVKKVQKTNVFSDLISTAAKKNSVIINLSDPVTHSEVLPSHSKNDNKTKGKDAVKFQIRAGKAFLHGQNQNNNASFSITSLLGDESSGNTHKGSNWLQSLQISDTEGPQEDPVSFGKKKIRNIVPGGFAEQMLKLQRIEKSEEVIWDHNVDRSKRKGKYLPLKLTSISSTADFVIAKCLQLQIESSENCIETTNPHMKGSLIEQVNEVSTESKRPKRVIVLLKKAVFNKLKLKVHNVFHLYPPWQTLHLPSISCPIILCAKFIDFIHEDEAIQNKISYTHPRSLSIFSTSTSNQASTCVSNIFYQWEQCVSLSGRIQRIWKVETTNKNSFPFISIPDDFRYSLLIQEQNGAFYELILSSTHCLPHLWREFISEAEGKCYEFHNLHAIHRFCLKKHPQLSRVLESLSTQQEGDIKGLKQEFCFQLAFPSSPGIPEAVSEEGFPTYCGITVQPLSSLSRDMNTHRFTCICKIIFHFNKSFYLCDDSVPKYVQLETLLPTPSSFPPVGSLVLIRDALFLEGCLYTDKYSSINQMSEESQMDERMKLLCGNRLSHLADISLQSVIPSINITSERSMFVFITGKVISVDENNALSWLQCNLCFSENLVQDANLVIYCENCLQVVPKPILNVRMSVMCQCSPCIKADIELLSRTTKKILQIDDDTHQPQCNVADILGKQIGPLFCFIKKTTSIDGIKQFCAMEIDTS